MRLRQLEPLALEQVLVVETVDLLHPLEVPEADAFVVNARRADQVVVLRGHGEHALGVALQLLGVVVEVASVQSPHLDLSVDQAADEEVAVQEEGVDEAVGADRADAGRVRRTGKKYKRFDFI